MTTATHDDLLALEEAQDQILEAIETLRQVQQRTDDGWARAYIVSHLECAATDDHEWLDTSPNLSDWIKKNEARAGRANPLPQVRD